MKWQEYITMNSDVCHGQACLKNTRIPVSVVLDNLATGMTHDEILQSYPSLTADYIKAVLVYAADIARERIIAT
jgi:uncharacterized protein (DUF433 family)